MKQFNIGRERDTEGRHIIAATLPDGRETKVKGLHKSLTVLDDIARAHRNEVHWIYTWQRVEGSMRRYRWTPEHGWQMLKKNGWYTF